MFLQTRIIVFYMTGQKPSDPSNKLVYYGGFADIVSACRRERQINEGSEVKLPAPSVICHVARCDTMVLRNHEH